VIAILIVFGATARAMIAVWATSGGTLTEPNERRRGMAQQGLGGTHSTSGVGERSARRMSGGAIASLTGIGVLVVFMIQNTADVTLHFLFWNFSWPLWLFTLVTAAFGALVWFGLGVLRRHRRRKARRDDRRG
jgi:uncharacterized integral membrane protein